MIHHIEIYVKDLKKTRAFYEQFLPLIGYTLFQEWKEGFSYKLQESYIVFVQVEKRYAETNYHRKNVGLNHLAFAVEDNKTVDKIRNLIKSYGVKELYSDAYPFAGGKNHYAFYFEDPDRIKLELVSKE